jgi:hypothetical protein
LSTSNIPSCVLNQVRQFQEDFQQFRQDLRAGNISAAQSDYVTLQKEVPQFNSPQTTDCDSQLAQAANQLAQGTPGSSATGHGPPRLPQDFYVQTAAAPPNHPPSASAGTSAPSKPGSLSIHA